MLVTNLPFILYHKEFLCGQAEVDIPYSEVKMSKGGRIMTTQPLILRTKHKGKKEQED